MTPVQSSNLKAVGYDCDGRVLRVEFHNGGVYDYDGVPERIAEDLLSAPSKGKFLAAEIKGRYGFHKVSGGRPGGSRRGR